MLNRGSHNRNSKYIFNKLYTDIWNLKVELNDYIGYNYSFSRFCIV
jgi:hypothetical protein